MCPCIRVPDGVAVAPCGLVVLFVCWLCVVWRALPIVGWRFEVLVWWYTCMCVLRGGCCPHVVVGVLVVWWFGGLVIGGVCGVCGVGVCGVLLGHPLWLGVLMV